MANGIFLLYVFLTTISGLMRGVRRQVWSLAVFVASAYLSGNAYTAFLPFMRAFITHETAGRFASFVIVFAVVSAVLSWIADILSGRGDDRTHDLMPVDRLGGAVVAIIQAIGTVEVFAALVFLYPILGWDHWLREADVFVHVFMHLPFMLPLLPVEFHQVLELIRQTP